MLNDKLQQVLSNEGAMAIVAKGEDLPHVVNTWHSYVTIDNDDLIIPVAGMATMEKLISKDARVLVTVGSKEVEGLHGIGTGFLIEGEAKMEFDTQKFLDAKERFPWARAVMRIHVKKAIQTT